jgi:DNA invertase Pin-like site-specific DNA recombinase
MHPHANRDEVWLYARNSTDEQRQEATILSQKDAVHQDAAGKGEQIAREYVDEARSGFTLVREQLDQMREDMRAPGSRCRVIRIYDKSRLARRAVLRHMVEDEAARLRIRIEYIAAPIFDDSAEGRFAEGVLDQLDEYFAVKLAENLRRGRYFDIRQGHVWWCPYGYKLVVVPGREWAEVQIDPELRPIVREIFTRIIAGESAGHASRAACQTSRPGAIVTRRSRATGAGSQASGTPWTCPPS